MNLFKLGTGAFNAVMCVSNGAKGLAAAKKEYKENGFTAEFFCDLLSVAGNGIGFAQSASAIKSSSNSLKNSVFGQNLKNSLSGMGSKVKSSFGTLGSKLGTKIRGGSKSGLNSINSLDDLLTNPNKLSGVSGEELYNYLVKNGYDVKPLNRGSFKGIPFEEGGGFKVNWGGDRILQYHPENLSHHGGAYFKISSGETGTIRIDLDGNLIN